MRFQKVVAINPPSPPGYVANKDSMGGFGQLFPRGAPVMPPLDLLYLASYLAAARVPLEVLEAEGLALSPEELARRVTRSAADGGHGRTLCVVRTSAPTLDHDLSVCAAIKDGARHVGVAVYGPVIPHVMARLQRETCLDYVVRGEPDAAVLELVRGEPEEGIRGLTYRRDGSWQDAPARAFNKELDRLPFPNWRLFPFKRYTLPRSSTTGPAAFLPMLTSRGCPYGCHYCPYPVGQGLPWRFRSPANVVDEMEHLVRDLGIQYILFRDPIFTLRMDRTVAICEEIQRRGLKVRWKCETRFDRVDEKTLRAMAAAGCEGINFGIESAEVEIQANVGRKPISPDEIVATVALCRSLKIKVFCFFIIGLPGDTIQTVLNTIAFAIRLRPNWVQFTAASPFIGTKLRDWAVSRGLVAADEYAYVNSHEAMIGNEDLTKAQVAALLRFAKFFERFLINRGGILKDDNRAGMVYLAGRKLADAIAEAGARAVFALGRSRFERVQPRPA